jgi:hypothetical protein
MPPIELKDVTKSYLTVFQSFNLVPMLTAEENIALPRWLDGISSEEPDLRLKPFCSRWDSSRVENIVTMNCRNYKGRSVEGDGYAELTGYDKLKYKPFIFGKPRPLRRGVSTFQCGISPRTLGSRDPRYHP